MKKVGACQKKRTPNPPGSAGSLVEKKEKKKLKRGELAKLELSIPGAARKAKQRRTGFPL